MALILLADDNLTTQKVFQLALEQEESRVRCFNTGQALLSHLATDSAELVALNLSLPDGNGYDLCRQIKSNPLHAHIPVVLLVGAFQTFDEERARGAGCTGHLSKPFETSELVRLVRSLLNQESVREDTLEQGVADDQSGDGEPAAAAGTVFELLPGQTRAGWKRLQRELHLALDPARVSVGESRPESDEPAVAKPGLSESGMEDLLQKLTARLPAELSRILPRLVEEAQAEAESSSTDSDSP